MLALRGLLLDIGGVVIRTPFELMSAAERAAGLPEGALGPRGVFTPDDDLQFRQVRDGTLRERDYWAQRAAFAAPLLGTPPDTPGLMRRLFDLPDEQVLRAETLALIDEVADDGVHIGLLTNDVGAFHGDGWIESKPFFRQVAAMVDGSDTGVLKPAAAAFEHGIAALGLPREQVVFVDDQPANVAGARAVGLPTVLFDVTDPSGSTARVRAALGRG